MKPLIQQIANLLSRLVPSAGTTGQVLGKNSDTNYDFGWITVTGGTFTEVDPVFTASASYGISGTNISNWNTAYGWGNHALAGYLTAETDPIFIASSAYTITGSDITNWGIAFTNTHTHSNLGLLETLIGNSSGNEALFNDGSYKSVLRSVSGSTGYIQYNTSGQLDSSIDFTYTNSSSLLTTPNVLVSNTTYIGNDLTYLSRNGGGDLVFTDANSGSISLATIIGGATNYWTSTTGGIYYSSYISNHTNPSAELDITGHILANNFDSNYLRYQSSNLLLGPNAGDLETGSNLLYIANTNTEYPLIFGDFTNQNLTFNADVYINQIKRLNFGDSDVYIRRDSSDNLMFRDPNANSGTEISLTDLTSLTGYALKSDFISYSAVTTITAANKATWTNKEDGLGNPSVSGYILSSSNAGVRSWVPDSGGGGVTPTNNLFKWDGTPNFYYRPYASKTEAGGVSSGGKFYLGNDIPTNTNKLSYDGVFGSYGYNSYETTGQAISGYVTSGIALYGYTSTTGTSVRGDTVNGLAIYGLSTGTGVAARFQNVSTTPNIAEFIANSITSCVINSTGINLVTGATYKVNGVNILSTKENSLGNPTIDGYILSSTITGTRSWIANSSTSPINGLLYWDGTAYNGYTVQTNGKFDSSSTIPIHYTTSLNYDGNLYATNFYSSLNSTVTTGSNINSMTASRYIMTLSTINRLDFNPLVTDGSTAVAYKFDTSTALITEGAKLLSLGNQGVEKVYITKDGDTYVNYLQINGGGICLNGFQSLTDGNSSGLVAWSGFSGSGTEYGIQAVSEYGTAALIKNGGGHANANPILVVSKMGVSSLNMLGDIVSIIDNPLTSGTISGSALKITLGTTIRTDLNPRVADGATAVAYIEDTHNNLTISGAKLKSFRNQGSEKVSIDKDGVIEITTVGQGVILKSPNGIRYKLTVANGGTLTVIAV